LAYAAREGPLALLGAMLRAGATKPPLLLWVAHLAVPLESVLGSYERALLLVNVAAGAATAALVYSTVVRIGAYPLAGVAAVLAYAGASLTVGMTHQFVVEPVQALTVAAMMRLSLEAQCLTRIRLVSLMIIGAALAMLAKTSSLALVVPFAFYTTLVRVVRPRAPCAGAGIAPGGGRDVILACLAAIVLGATLSWYVFNWSFVVAHVRAATSTEVALLYGSVGTLGSKLHFWLTALAGALTPWPSMAVGIGLLTLTSLLVAAVRVLRSPTSMWVENGLASGTLFAFCVAGTVSAALLVYASQINEETRFLAPVLPLVAVLLGWSLAVLRRQWLGAAVAAILVGNAGAAHLYAHGVLGLPPSRSPWLLPSRAEPDSIERLARAVRLSCDPKVSRWSFVGVELPDFNPDSAMFVSQKQRRERGVPCGYTFVAFAETDPQKGMKRIYDHDAEFFVTLRRDLLPNDPSDALNRIARPVAEIIEKSPDWARVSAPADAAQVFRRKR
jgi:hypothetical protein